MQLFTFSRYVNSLLGSLNDEYVFLSLIFSGSRGEFTYLQDILYQLKLPFTP